jgi:hypothetical protein
MYFELMGSEGFLILIRAEQDSSCTELTPSDGNLESQSQG